METWKLPGLVFFSDWEKLLYFGSGGKKLLWTRQGTKANKGWNYLIGLLQFFKIWGKLGPGNPG